MFSIIIPTFNNIRYLKKCIESIKKNSEFNHEIIPHINEGSDGTEEYLIKENIKYTKTNYNSGICEGMNKAAKKSSLDYNKLFCDFQVSRHCKSVFSGKNDPI